MSEFSFTKLFSSITKSTVWCEPHTTVRVWIAMLADSDSQGRVYAAVPGLANLSRVTVPECESALATFLSPDPYSRTPDNEGRRIKIIDGGWQLLNYDLYREKRNPEARTEQNRDAKRRSRARQHQSAEMLTDCDETQMSAQGRVQSTDKSLKDSLRSSSSPPAADDAPDEGLQSEGKAATQALAQQRLSQVTDDATAAYNAICAKPHGLMPRATAPGRDTRQANVRRVLKVASAICQEHYGDPRITVQFWTDYLRALQADEFHSGRQGGGKGHDGWTPDFEFVTQRKTMLRIYERAGDAK